MNIVEIEYSRLFSFGDYNNERITLRAETDSEEDVKKLYLKVLELHEKFQRHRTILDSLSALKHKENNAKNNLEWYERRLKDCLFEMEQLNEKDDRRSKCRLIDLDEEIQQIKERIKEVKEDLKKINEKRESLLKEKEELEKELTGGNNAI